MQGDIENIPLPGVRVRRSVEGFFLGKTLAIFRVKPNEDSTPNECIGELKGVKSGKFADAKENPIGFGIVVIKAAFMLAEKDDEAVNKVTAELNKMKTVEEAELEGLTLL